MRLELRSKKNPQYANAENIRISDFAFPIFADNERLCLSKNKKVKKDKKKKKTFWMIFLNIG